MVGEPLPVLVRSTHCDLVVDACHRLIASPAAFVGEVSHTCPRCWKIFSYRARDTFNWSKGATVGDFGPPPASVGSG